MKPSGIPMAQLLRQPPATALALLAGIQNDEQRRSLAASWKYADINTAWNAVSCSNLSAADKQVMFNELWS
jgi:hypothetical protein